MEQVSARFVLLCEDEQIACFIRRFLKNRGVPRHDIRESIAPPGSGSGEQWVRRQYPNELKAIRTQDGVALIVGTDADKFSVVERIDSLNQECRINRLKERQTNDRVVMIVPKRNIETWFAYLRGDIVNEMDIYKRYDNESDCRDNVRSLDEMCRKRQLRAPVPPSLETACKEYEKLNTQT